MSTKLIKGLDKQTVENILNWPRFLTTATLFTVFIACLFIISTLARYIGQLYGLAYSKLRRASILSFRGG